MKIPYWINLIVDLWTVISIRGDKGTYNTKCLRNKDFQVMGAPKTIGDRFFQCVALEGRQNNIQIPI